MTTAAYTSRGGGTGDGDVSVAGGVGKDGEADKTLADLVVQLITTGFNNQWGDAYKAALAEKKKNRSDGAWLKRALWPIDFSVTMDGCSGWKFGDAVSTNLIPSHYAGIMFFTVTTIQHKVSAAGWETTLNTAARVKNSFP